MTEAGDRARKALDELRAAMSEMGPDEARLFVGELMSGLTSIVMAPPPSTSTLSYPAKELELD